MKSLSADPKTLVPAPWNANRVTHENLSKLKRSIQDLGFNRAVIVREVPGIGLQILGGHHGVQVAIELGITEVPIVNLGRISDVHAKKVSLADNSRYGTDDTISLAQVYEEIGLTASQLAEFLPYTEVDFDTVRKAIEINLDELDIDIPEEPLDPEDLKKRPDKTHDFLKFRMVLGDAERVRQLIEKTMKREGFTDDDEMTAAGSALAFLLLNDQDD